MAGNEGMDKKMVSNTLIGIYVYRGYYKDPFLQSLRTRDKGIKPWPLDQAKAIEDGDAWPKGPRQEGLPGGLGFKV